MEWLEGKLHINQRNFIKAYLNQDEVWSFAFILKTMVPNLLSIGYSGIRY